MTNSTPAKDVYLKIQVMVYAVLSLGGSILLLKYRKDLVEEYNVKQYVTDENMRKAVFIFGQFWLITNCSLIFGLLMGRSIYVKIHIFYQIGLLVGLMVTAIIVALVILSKLIGSWDEVDVPWLSMIGLSLLVTAGLTLACFIIIGILLVCVAMTYFPLQRVIESFNPTRGSKPVQSLKKTEPKKETGALKTVNVVIEAECDV